MSLGLGMAWTLTAVLNFHVASEAHMGERPSTFYFVTGLLNILAVVFYFFRAFRPKPASRNETSDISQTVTKGCW